MFIRRVNADDPNLRCEFEKAQECTIQLCDMMLQRAIHFFPGDFVNARVSDERQGKHHLTTRLPRRVQPFHCRFQMASCRPVSFVVWQTALLHTVKEDAGI
jgi:hypothetical protein